MALKFSRLVARVKSRPLRFYFFLVVILATILFATTLFYSHFWYSAQSQKGGLAEDQLFPATQQVAYKNLDLKIAAQAKYGGSQIKKIRDLGIENNVRISVVTFNVSPDGLTEFGLMTEPVSKKPANGFPVLILLHGYVTPNRYSTTLFYRSDMEEYSKSGFVVIKPDLRGQGLSLHDGKAEGAYYSMAYNTDVMSLIADIKSTDYLDSSNISLWGHSMGAYIALRAAVISPDIKNVILLSGPVGRVSDMFNSYVAVSDRNNPVARYIREAVLLRYGTPDQKPKFWNATSPLSYLSQLNANVQINVGTADKIVPPHFSADLNRALNNARKPHEYYIYQGGSHGLVDERPLIYQRSLKLLLNSLNG